MKLIEYLNINYCFGDDYITLLRMDNMVKEIVKTNSNYLYVNESMDMNLQPITPISIISMNPDTDFPKPKKYIKEKYNDSMPFDKEQQDMLEQLDYFYKVDIDVLENIGDNVKRIFLHSVGKLHPKLTMLPIGRDFKNESFFKYADGLSKKNKPILCYYNVTLPPNVFHWYGMIRTHIYNIVKQKDFIKHKKCDMHPRTYSQNDIASYYDDLSQSKFVICPRGCGIDTYRLWDSIYMGCIPIIEKYEGYQQFEDLPILFIQHWKEIEGFTREYLESKWIEMVDKEYNYDKLRLSYWKHRILEE